MDETFNSVQKELRERVKRVDALKPAAAIEKKTVSSKIKGLENQLEQVESKCFLAIIVLVYLKVQ